MAQVDLLIVVQTNDFMKLCFGVTIFPYIVTGKITVNVVPSATVKVTVPFICLASRFANINPRDYDCDNQTDCCRQY